MIDIVIKEFKMKYGLYFHGYRSNISKSTRNLGPQQDITSQRFPVNHIMFLLPIPF